MARLIPSGRARLVSPQVRDARREAEAIRARAMEDAAHVREVAQREGRIGAEAGVLSAMVSLAEQTNALRDGASREVATLALEIAARIVHEAVAIDGALLERIVQRALVRAKDESRVRLRLHPEDREALIARFADRGGLPAAIQIVDAEGQLRGGCVVSSERISIDARVESAIEAIARAMGVDGPGT